MKKIYTSFLMLTVAVSATFAQSKIQTPNKQVNTSKYADRAIESGEVRGGGLSCPVAEGFDAGFPVSWTNQAVNANENWTYAATGGNPDGHMDIAYDAALALQDESLITAPIDLSAIPTVGLYFDWSMSYYWGVDPNENYDLTVSISVDGGTNYTALWSEADAGVFDSFVWYTKVLDLSAYASENAAIFKFNYNGIDGAQAKFDNINFCSLPANDLRLDMVYTGDVINDYIYTRIPLSQATEVIAGAIALNFGVASQTNLSYDWTVTLDGSSVASGTATGAATLAPGAVDTVWVSTGYTPTATGEVVVSFAVSADQTENVPTDNTKEESLLVTDYEWGHDYEDEDYFGFGYAGNDPDGSGGFEFGSRFFCQTDGDMIYALQFPLSSTTTSVSVTAKVYEDMTTSPAVSETVYDIQAGDLSGTNVNFITIVLDDPVTMTSGSVYIATLAIEAGDSGYIMGNDIDDNDAGQVVYFVNDDTWYNWVGLTTAMRLNLDETIGIEDNEDVSGIYIFPNPASDVLNVGFVSKQNQNIDMNIISLDGSLIQTQQVIARAGQSNSVRFNTENLAAGVYMIQMIGANSSLTQKVVVQ